MTFDEFLADFKVEHETYMSGGLIDDLSIYKWVVYALKPLGNNIMVLQDAVVEVRNGRAKLPDNFYTLFSAHLCELDSVTCDEKYKPVLQKSHQYLLWKERHERAVNPNPCGNVCVDNKVSVITETVYFNDIPAQVRYKRPTLLRLGKTFRRNACSSNCRNKVVKDNPNEIIIDGTTLHANFNFGTIYLQYYGLDTDEDGKVTIPDLGLGNIPTYVETYVKFKFFEKLLINKEGDSIQSLFNYYAQTLDVRKGAAMTEAKFSKLTPKDMYKIRLLNQKDINVFERTSFQRRYP